MGAHDMTTQPLGIPLGRLLPHEPVTDPIPVPARTEQIPLAPAAPAPVRIAETCGPCGGSLSLECVGHTGAIRVITDWRGTHRCREPDPEPDAAGMKAAHIERVGFTVD